MVERTEGWPERLADVIDGATARPFSWADHNCGLFVADCMLALTGVDPAAGLRGGDLSDASAAREALRDNGARGGSVGDFAARIAKDWGAEAVAPAYAQRGDVAVVRHAGQAVLGIVWGGMIVVLTPDGIGRLPLSEAQRLWRVQG